MRELNGYGSLSRLMEFKSLYDRKNILLVTGKQSFETSGAKQICSQLLKSQRVVQFMDFDVNPKIDDAIKGAKLAKENAIEIIISIGGGSVLDTAKLVKAFYLASGNEIAIAKSQDQVLDPSIPIIAVPTTAGSGSEATHFAVVYIGDEKYSLASQCLLADAVVLDGSLVQSGGKYLKTCNALDAMAQAIESFWAVGATEQSRKFALNALELGWKVFPEFISEKCSDETAQQFIEAANQAGKAINISKTTAAHAWSYALTSLKDIPHGHAVWLTLPMIFELHYQRSNDSNPELAMKMDKLCQVLNLDPISEKSAQLRKYLSVFGVLYDFADLNIGVSERSFLSRSVNMERMKNNPVSFFDEEISQIFDLTKASCLYD
jgi:alcohol dehydrogenase class IV